MGARPAVSRLGRGQRRGKQVVEGQKKPGAQPVLVGRGSRARELEVHSLRLLLRQPEALYLLDRALQQFGLARFGPEDFEHSDYQTVARLVQQSLEQDGLDPHEFILESTPESLKELGEELQAPMQLGEPNEDKLIEDLVRTVVLLREARLNEGIEQLRMMQQDLQEQGELQMTPYHQIMLQYTQTLNRLNLAMAHPLQFEN